MDLHGDMQDILAIIERRTATDQVFDQLYEEIVSLKLHPGTKLSEVEVARRFGVSRQPVRDAFNRLSGMDLLIVRPQKATEVRGFSLNRIEDARFIRLAVELEVLRRACGVWDKTRATTLQKNLDAQAQCVDAIDPDGMRELDYEFHGLICKLAGCPDAFETIKQQKQKVDRLCVLEYDRKVSELSSVLEDHRKIATALKSKSVDKVTTAARKHFAHLDETIDYIHTTHSEYFESE
ncbi:MAG: GntR family transcriptional regulator [Pseudomonadota bacterium]